LKGGVQRAGHQRPGFTFCVWLGLGLALSICHPNSDLILIFIQTLINDGLRDPEKLHLSTYLISLATNTRGPGSKL